MSMNFSEFKKILGADPHSDDPEFRAARESSPEFEAAAREAEALEEKLARAFRLPVPYDLAERISALAQQPAEAAGRRRWAPMALAASLLVAIGAAGFLWNSSPRWDSVEEYVVDHYRHDGPRTISQAGHSGFDEVQALFARFDVEAAPALADLVGFIKYCPTPDGKGVHMVLNTGQGPVTVIYMPETSVQDREVLEFDDVEAVLVELDRGSAAIIGARNQGIQDLYATVHDAIIPLPDSS